MATMTATQRCTCDTMQLKLVLLSAWDADWRHAPQGRTTSAAQVASAKDPKRSEPMPAMSPTLSPTLSAANSRCQCRLCSRCNDQRNDTVECECSADVPPAMTAGLRGSSSGMSFSICNNMHAIGRSHADIQTETALKPAVSMHALSKARNLSFSSDELCACMHFGVGDLLSAPCQPGQHRRRQPWCRCRRRRGRTARWRSHPGRSR
jgi:hypothetical protein